MSRKTSNFIKAYEQYTQHSEAPTLYHIWTCLFMLSTAVRRKVWYDEGFDNLYPNLYLVFISPPGKGRKSSAAKIGIKILKELDDITFSSESTTREALIKDIVGSASSYMLPDGTPQTHCSLSIFSSEWSVFIGHKNSGNEPMIALLTDVFDCPDKWAYRTKLSGSDYLENVFLSKLACTTFDYLASSLPLDAIGGGLTSRIIFVVEFNRRKKVYNPKKFMSKEETLLKKFLLQDLEEISLLQGEMVMTDEADAFFKAWYEAQEDDNPEIKDERFFGYLARKPSHIVKIAMLFSLAEGNSLSIELSHLTRALSLLKQTEKNMPFAFGARGRNTTAVDLERILEQIVQTHKGNPNRPIPQRVLAKANYRHVDRQTLNNILEYLEVDMKQIRRTYEGNEWVIRYIGELGKEGA